MFVLFVARFVCKCNQFSRGIHNMMNGKNKGFFLNSRADPVPLALAKDQFNRLPHQFKTTFHHGTLPKTILLHVTAVETGKSLHPAHSLELHHAQHPG
jgi:hypothetical protein